MRIVLNADLSVQTSNIDEAPDDSELDSRSGIRATVVVEVVEYRPAFVSLFGARPG